MPKIRRHSSTIEQRIEWHESQILELNRQLWNRENRSYQKTKSVSAMAPDLLDSLVGREKP